MTLLISDTSENDVAFMTSSTNFNSGFNSGSGSSAHSAVAEPVVVAKRDPVTDWV